APRLPGPPVAQPLVEALVHVGRAVVAAHQLHLARVGERAPADPATGGAAQSAARAPGTGRPAARRREAALHASRAAGGGPAPSAGRARSQAVEEAAGAAVRAAARRAGERPGQVQAL